MEACQKSKSRLIESILFHFTSMIIDNEISDSQLKLKKAPTKQNKQN